MTSWFMRIAAAGVACGLALATLVGVTAASAANSSDFEAGNIISDERFFDNGSMSEEQIAQFLKAQVPACRATDPTLPCLRDLVTSTSDRSPAANGCAAYKSEGWESAARIIWKVAQACRINPQVLLVTLQKEQSLVTSTKPSLDQYNAAMGANCPDGRPCDPNTQGFFNQVYKSAWQFRQYTHTPSSWGYRVGLNSILFSPDRGCGSAPVVIRNQATANLYIYTPYQPNAAALNNLYGRGDSCSTYGNRNFWRIFTDWFGSTTATGTTPIDSLYTAMGGASGALGAVASDYIPISTSSGAGTGRAYANGSIYWSPRTGTAAVLEPFRSFYFGYGGATGILGWPNSQTIALPQRTGGAAQSYLHGSVYTSTSTGTHSVVGSLRDTYFGYGGATGWLGWPTAEASSVSSTGGPRVARGLLQEFEYGYLTSESATGNHAVNSAIGARYVEDGGPNSALGWPVSEPLTYDYNGGGTAQVFEGGSIFASHAGAFALQDSYRDVYFAVGGAQGWLGWPTTGPICPSIGVCWQHFQNASILKDSTGTRIALAAIEDLHAAAGGDGGEHGARTSGLVRIIENGGGLGQVYQNTSVYFSSSGTYAVSGDIRARYWEMKGAAGPLGFPMTPETCGSASSCEQSFEGGTIVWSEEHGTLISSGAIAEAYWLAGGRETLGEPRSEVLTIPENGGGVAQVFESGSVYSSTAGAFAVLEPVRSVYFGYAGSAGDFGWPTGPMECEAGVCSQSFQGGVISAASQR